MPAMPNPGRPARTSARPGWLQKCHCRADGKNSDSGQNETAAADAIAQAAVDGHQNHIGQSKCAGCPSYDVSAHGESVAQDGQGHAAHGRTERHDRRRYHQRIENEPGLLRWQSALWGRNRIAFRYVFFLYANPAGGWNGGNFPCTLPFSQGAKVRLSDPTL